MTDADPDLYAAAWPRVAVAWTARQGEAPGYAPIAFRMSRFRRRPSNS